MNPFSKLCFWLVLKDINLQSLPIGITQFKLVLSNILGHKFEMVLLLCVFILLATFSNEENAKNTSEDL